MNTKKCLNFKTEGIKNSEGATGPWSSEVTGPGTASLAETTKSSPLLGADEAGGVQREDIGIPFKLEDNCIPILYWFLPYNTLCESAISIHVSPP